ncbi:hypothetical protein NC652_013411 [Populus alba x Populus x berolinensis]|nr:hypothetical protein NC652_013411 [Populus alba x Populus x berolinensis]
MKGNGEKRGKFALASTYNAGDGHIFDVVAYKFSEAPESAAAFHFQSLINFQISVNIIFGCFMEGCDASPRKLLNHIVQEWLLEQMSWQLLQETVTMVRAKKITLGLKFVYNPNSIFVHYSAKSPLGLKCKWEEEMGQMALSLRLQEWRETFFTRMTFSQVI